MIGPCFWASITTPDQVGIPDVNRDYYMRRCQAGDYFGLTALPIAHPTNPVLTSAVAQPINGQKGKREN